MSDIKEFLPGVPKELRDKITEELLTGDETEAPASDATAIHSNVSGEVSALATKASPVGADYIIIEDSEDSYKKKKVLVSNL